ncbi:ABC transporter substrate-binding protein [Paenibacillus humicola]|uniref:ABC transporter substrate-binding protein n=1 Tax=Paenibacillus humicola TaxID=3110540 RepID=UPI00237A63F0|nr:sugar ABC transporter substrate-binding protein [Paenibacillus humicola]
MKFKRNVLRVLAPAMAMSLLLSACGGGGGSGNGSGDSAESGSGAKVKIKWATWGNPGELTRFQEFTKEFNKTHPNIEAELIPIPGEYEQKILTQLSGGTAPDIFYGGDTTIVKLIDNGSIEELTPYFERADSTIKTDDYADGLWGPAKSGDKIFGVPVDCNPMVLWYNKKVLSDAGITEDPADLQQKGEWNWDKFQDMTAKLHAAGKYGYVVENSWNTYYSWITGNEGKVYDDSGKFIADTDPKAVETWKYFYDNLKAGNFTFAGTLPKGQGSDAMFMSFQLGFAGAGRWYLPEFKQNKDLSFDVVPFPTKTGQVEPAAVATAYLTMNKATQHKDEAWQFMQAFLSKEGQTFRLQGGGNAVPSVKGADDVVLEGNIPAHAKTFLDTRERGYVIPTAEASIPGLSSEITSALEELWLKNIPLEQGLKNLGEKANAKIKDVKG